MDAPKRQRKSGALNTGLKNGGLKSYADTIREKLQGSLAAQVVVDAMKGKKVSQTQLKAASISLNKCVPDLKAVYAEVRDTTPKSIEDVSARLLELGLNPETAFAMLGVKPAALNGSARLVSSEPGIQPESKSTNGSAMAGPVPIPPESGDKE